MQQLPSAKTAQKLAPSTGLAIIALTVLFVLGSVALALSLLLTIPFWKAILITSGTAILITLASD